jgi:hypothetical protein
MSKLRKILFAIAAVGGAATAVGAGTFASFTASTTNAGSTFATGTLVLSNQKNTATACLSTGGGSTDSNANSACDGLFSASVQKPGDTAFVDVTLNNGGSINASALTGYRNAACANANVGSYSGTGDLCGALQLYVQEYTSASNRTNNTTAGGTCHYGGGTASVCAFDASKTVAAFPASGSPITMGSLDAGASRYLRVHVQIPSSAGNEMQGRQATFGFTWAIAQ